MGGSSCTGSPASRFLASGATGRPRPGFGCSRTKTLVADDPWHPAKWRIEATVAWPTDLAFAAGRSFRQLPSPRHLGFDKTSGPKSVPLHDAEFARWPADAPKLLPVASFEDEHGGRRVLARTEGPFPWEQPARAGAE